MLVAIPDKRWLVASLGAVLDFFLAIGSPARARGGRMPQRVVQMFESNQISVGWLDARASPEVLFVGGRRSFHRVAPADGLVSVSESDGSYQQSFGRRNINSASARCMTSEGRVGHAR